MADDKKDRNRVDATSVAYDYMLPFWEMVDTLCAGTMAMRAAGETYLPKHEAETTTRYKERLECNVLTNYLGWTIAQLSAKPFKNEVSVNEDVPEAVRTLLEDIDLQGNALHPFCARWFELGLRKGLAHVLIDQPVGQPKEDGSPRTLDDDRKDGIRPYWNMIDPQNVICAIVQTIRGKETLVHVRIRELAVERQGYAEVLIPQIRVLEPGTWAVYQERETKKDGKSIKEYVLTEQGVTGLSFIPLVTFYANRIAPQTAEPPLMDLAHLNVTHWQSTSDQRSILTVSRFPILAASGVPVADDGSAKLKLSPHQYFATEDPQGKFYYVEHQGSAIEAGRNDLKDLEEKMASYGADMLRAEPGNPTATAKALDTAEDATPLQRMVVDFTDSVNLALQYTAVTLQLGEDAGGTVTIDYDPADDVGGDGDLEALIKLRATGDISRQAILGEFKRRHVLSEDFDPEEDQALLDQEVPKPGDPNYVDPNANPGDAEDDNEPVRND